MEGGERMNDKEQMQALLDGKILMCDGERYKLDEDGDLTQQCVESGGTYWYKLGGCEFSFYSGNYVVDESKCVDFAHAMGMMAEGKVMKCLWSELEYRINNGVLEAYYDNEWWGKIRREGFGDEEMKSMWEEVVE